MLDTINAAICLDILRLAAGNRGLCVRHFAQLHNVATADLVAGLADLSVAGVLVCETTPVVGFVSLALGPKSLQAIFLFALNCDDLGDLPASFLSAPVGGLANEKESVGGFVSPAGEAVLVPFA